MYFLLFVKTGNKILSFKLMQGVHIAMCKNCCVLGIHSRIAYATFVIGYLLLVSIWQEVGNIWSALCLLSPAYGAFALLSLP